MNRRSYLAGLALLPATITGCIANPPRQNQTTPPPANAEPPTSARDSTLSDDVPITVTVHPETPTGPTETIEFHVTNAGDHPFQMQEYGWRLYKHVDDAWRYLSPKIVPAVYAPVKAPPGGSYTYDIRLDNTNLRDTIYDEDGPDEHGGYPLGGGQYRFAIDGAFIEDPAQTPAPGTDTETTVGVDFTIDAEQLPLALTEDRTVISRSPDAATVAPTTGSRDPDDQAIATLHVERTDRDTLPEPTVEDEWVSGRHLFREELLGPATGTIQNIRNALAAFESTTRTVDLHTPDHSIPPFGLEPDTDRYAYFEGYVYRFSTQNWSWE